MDTPPGADRPHELKEFWLNRALGSAGIDRGRWDPSVGVAENRRAIEAVYAYYGRLFLDQPHLRWAGMASLIGPSFYAGFLDLGFVPDAARRLVMAVFGPASARLAAWAAGDLGFYETTFLVMQKKIFEDQAPMHEAYLGGGLPEVEKLYRARIIDLATFVAWQQIDAGRAADGGATLVDSGNRTLLWREQRDIIDRFYVLMLGHRRPVGAMFMYVLTLAGAPSVPGARAFAEVYPLSVSLRAGRRVVSLRTPLADGNIAVFRNRWNLIETDTLPDYLAFIDERAAEARALVATPISRRVGQYRVLLRAAGLLAAATARWGWSVSAEDGPGRRLAVRSARPAEPESLVIDLTGRPTREALGFAPAVGSRLWMRADRRTLAVTVRLPGGPAYRAEAQMAAALSSVAAGKPDRLTVALAPADLPATERLLREYAAEWRFPADAVAGWRAGAERRAGSDRAYSTHVFTPEAVGFVHLEFQVAHHVSAGLFVTSALFSW